IPGSFERVLNSPIQKFHQQPDFVMSIISDVSKMPFQSIINIGDDNIEVSITAIYDMLNQHIGAMVTWEIITEKLSNEIKMSRVVAMAENSPISILSADLEGNINYMNPASYKLLATMKDFLPVSVNQVLGSNYDIFHENPLHQEQLLSDPRNLPYSSKIKLGEEIFSLKVNAIYDQSQQYIGIMVIWDSLTDEIKEKNTQLEKLLFEAKQASIAKSSFLSNMSHELRTPLNGIIGFTEMLLDGNLGQEQRESLKTIKTCSDSLLDLINDILDLNKIEANKMTLEYKAVNLEDIIYDCNEIVRNKIDNQDIEMLVNIDNIYSHVISDSIRLRQVFNNLLSNAVKFTESGEIVTSAMVQSEDDENICLRLSVKDTGIGIDPKNHPKVFRSFEQADLSTTRKYGGTGLGLSITKRIVELMDSELKLESQLHQGSKFYFDLKLKKHIVSSQVDQSKIQDRRIRGKKVIVVDDNMTSLEILYRFCMKLDLVTFKASSCIEALEIIKVQKPELALIDINMPNYDGFCLHDILENTEIPIKLIAVTADIRPSTAAKIKASHFEGHLTKPIRRMNLYNLMIKVFNLDKKETIVEKAVPIEEQVISLNILVAEDNKINQKMILKLLKRMGHKTILAEDGEEAIQAVLDAELDFDIIFMDMQMPNMNGLDATIAIKKSGSSIPIVAVTANATVEDQKLCKDAGMVDFIAKPLVRQDIHQVLKTHTKAQSLIRDDLPKILIADDNDLILDSLEKLIAELMPHAIVKTASDGIEASILLGAFLPNLLITDVMMPNMNGYDLMKYIQQEDRFKELKVIVLSSLASSDPLLSNILAFKNTNYVSKPFKSEQLMKHIQQCLR
ncbi:response regulator, partial [bacterium]|nr:response regulator [bacterium]